MSALAPSGTPLVFVPGLLNDERLWQDQRVALSDLGETFVADTLQDDSIGAMAARLLDEAPAGPFVLIGLSMGGYVAFEVVRQAPDRVAALALFDTTAAPDPPSRRAAREMGLKSLAAGRFQGVTDRLLPKLVDARHLDGPVGDEVKVMARRVGGEAFVRQQTAIIGRVDSRPLLPQITAPTLVAVGDRDQLTPPAEAVAMFRELPRPAFHLFHRCGHLPPLEKPEETSELLRRWLAGELPA
ncbi:alpha/beta fold hydrolase [Phenylobacterium deserti]|uniref:Alpha/beta hydrolase n=1 Tax=Phenylobacterium deserti TaxID=1914756 RepID=A0A328APM6_9CAUL|nr:alpha/beta hydrolase [Phenylobacterium deserti]RAK56962.1 alpha/beta hydrolase [Phenylobacterium deserti]